jgi:arylsulfatase A-like enzyme/lipopolysaccharide biosynthesis regulator YciM
MNKKLLTAAGAAVVLLAVAAVLFFRLRPPSFPRLAGDKTYNVVLITVDTLRADRLGCYGFAGVETPTIDLFADKGVRFERCTAVTPLTLPSHTTLLTGTYPLFHGVRDNGGFVVPSELVTLAEVYKERSYATAAFVGAYVLDSKWGLNQGFDYYFDQFDLSKFEKISLANVQRPGSEVMDEALRWLETKADAPFFAWIHLYDPHTPYEPPSPYRERYPQHPYLGEIASTDAQLARLWSFLGDRALRERTFLVLAADHGESLGEHQEAAHGFFVYEATVHVPLIFVTPFPRLQGVVAPAVVSLADIFPTLCEMSGQPPPGQAQGRSLVPHFLKPGRPSEGFAYAETFYPRFHYGWSELQSVRDGRYKLILSPEPELYDLEADPAEGANIIEKERSVFLALNERATAFTARAARGGFELDYRKIDEETRTKLAALGYIGSFSDPAKLRGKRLASPRAKIGIFNALSRAREMGLEGDAAEAIAAINRIIAEDPEITDAYFSLGNIHFRLGAYEKAIEAFRRSLERKPDDSFTVINIANSYLALGRFADAEKFVLDYLASGFSDAQLYFLLGNMNFLQKKYDAAVPYLERSLSLNAESASSHNTLAAIYIVKDDLDRAQGHLDAARRLNPRLGSLSFNQAQLYEKRGDFARAAEAYRDELAQTPRHFKSLYNLTRLYRQTGEEELELQTLRRCVEIDPDFPLTYFYLARIYLNRGENYEEAIALVRKGIDLKPDPAELPLGYFLLADLYNRTGNGALSAEYARKGQASAADRAR